MNLIPQDILDAAIKVKNWMNKAEVHEVLGLVTQEQFNIHKRHLQALDQLALMQESQLIELRIRVRAYERIELQSVAAGSNKPAGSCGAN